MLEALALDVLADLISSLIIVAITAAAILVASAINRRRILRFFGIASRRPSVKICVSRLQIKPGGTTGADPEIKNGYVGPAINHIEYIGADLVRHLLRSKSIAILPQRIGQWLSENAFHIRIVDPQVEVSPQAFSLAEPDLPDTPASASETLIVLGSSVYNTITQAYLSAEGYPYRFVRKNGVLVLEAKNGGEVRGRPERELAILQRITDKANGRSVFLCAGIGTSATLGAVQYLTREWRGLQKRFGEADFVVCLAFQPQAPDSPAVVRPSVPPGGFHFVD